MTIPGKRVVYLLRAIADVSLIGYYGLPGVLDICEGLNRCATLVLSLKGHARIYRFHFKMPGITCLSCKIGEHRIQG